MLAVGLVISILLPTLCYSKTTTPAFRRNNPSMTELAFSPSPAKYAMAIDMDDVFCTQENQDQCYFPNNPNKYVSVPRLPKA